MTAMFGNLLRSSLFLILIVLVGIGINAGGPLLPFSRGINRLAVEVVALAAICFIYFFFRVSWEKRPCRALPLYPSRGSLSKLLWGIAIGGAMFGVVLSVNIITGSIAVQRTAFSFFPLLEQIFLVCLTMFIVAIWEETAIRGYLLPNVAECVGVHGSCVVVAIAFGLLHLLGPLKSAQIVVSVFFASLMLNYVYMLSGSLYLPIGIHFSWNALISVFSRTAFQIDVVNPFLAGIRGLEEGAVAIAVSAIAALVAVLLSQKPRRDVLAES